MCPKGKHFCDKMADNNSGSSDFEDFIDELVRNQDLGFGSDNQSNISLSSVHTSHLSNLNSDSDLGLSRSSSDDDVLSDDDNWTDNIVEPDISDFISSTGPTKPLEFTAKPIDYFYQLFPNSLLQKIANETNLYAQQIRPRIWRIL